MVKLSSSIDDDDEEGPGDDDDLPPLQEVEGPSDEASKIAGGRSMQCLRSFETTHRHELMRIMTSDIACVRTNPVQHEGSMR